jgi:hypothetical protein
MYKTLKKLKIKLNNIHPNIYYNFKVFQKKKIKLQRWQNWRRRNWLVVPRTIWPKRRRTLTTHLWSHVHDELAKLFIIHRELLILLFQGYDLFKQGTRYWLGAPDTTKRLMSSPKCRSVEVINNLARPGLNNMEVNCINYK